MARVTAWGVRIRFGRRRSTQPTHGNSGSAAGRSRR
jgi:hypothetical protein